MDDTEDTAIGGGESLTVEQAANAFVKATATGADEGQPEPDDDNEGEELAEDDLEGDEPDEDDEGDPDDDEDGQAEEEDDDEPETEGGKFVAGNGKVKLPDGSVVTVSELIQGNLRDRDYRQKTMRHAEEVRQFQAQSESLKSLQTQTAEREQLMGEFLRSVIPPPPDPELLNDASQHFDPIAYQRQEANHKAWLNYVSEFDRRVEAVKQAESEKQAQTRNQKSAQEWEALTRSRPELLDTAKANAFVETVQKAGLAAGFTQEELANTLPYDRRMVSVLEKAAKWDRLQQQKPKAKQQVEGRPPVQKSGKRMSKQGRAAVRASDAMKRLQATGSVEDATAAYLASLNKG